MKQAIQVGVVMGSNSDWETMRNAVDILEQFGIAHEARVVSAHRMPDELFAYAESAAGRGLTAIIAGAGGAAHLPGMLAAKTTVPVLGVPVASRHLQGVDSLYSIVQMPKGVPVATFAIGNAGAANAALFAVAMLAVTQPELRTQLDAFRLRQTQAAQAMSLPPDAPKEVSAGLLPDFTVLAARRRRAMTALTKPLLPGATLGVIGGGQLGRMFVHAAQRMGYFTAVLDPDPDSPAGRVSHHHIHTDYIDVDGLARLAGLADAITTEFENVPAPSLEHLAVARPVAPAAFAVAIAQDRIREKSHFVGCGVECAPYAVIDSADHLAVPSNLLPGILKTARLGYDGKGQQRVETREDLALAWEQAGNLPCVLEKLMPLACECSVIVARGADGQVVHFPPQRNLHRNGILAVTEVYADNLAPAVGERAVAAATSIAEGLDYVGVLCVEFFVLEDGNLVVNEMAPRPHNSGHWTMDGCDLSQFELQVRTLAGLPLNVPRQHSPAIMLNLLGDLWFPDADIEGKGTPAEPRWADVLALPGTHLHLYGKSAPRRGRKMGHLTLTGDAIESVRSTADFAAALLGLPIPLSE